MRYGLQAGVADRFPHKAPALVFALYERVESTAPLTASSGKADYPSSSLKPVMLPVYNVKLRVSFLNKS